MKLIYIYGPPATGKLTVAEELRKLTKYKIFHNQLTVDLLNSILPFGFKGYWKLNSKIRLLILEAAAKQKVKGIIYTHCYAKGEDDKTVKKTIKLMKKYKGKIHFVNLVCDKKELHKRVKHASRENFDKLRSVRGLNLIFKKYELFSSIPYVKSLRIDNTSITPKQTAKKIKSCFGL